MNPMDPLFRSMLPFYQFIGGKLSIRKITFHHTLVIFCIHITYHKILLMVIWSFDSILSFFNTEKKMLLLWKITKSQSIIYHLPGLTSRKYNKCMCKNIYDLLNLSFRWAMVRECVKRFYKTWFGMNIMNHFNFEISQKIKQSNLRMIK